MDDTDLLAFASERISQLVIASFKSKKNTRSNLMLENAFEFCEGLVPIKFKARLASVMTARITMAIRSDREI